MLRRVSLLVACLCGAACNRATTVDFSRVKPPGTSQGAVVARFGGDTITDAELNQRFAEMNPYLRSRYQTVEQRREYVEGLVRFELLAQEAARRGLASDPEVVENTKRLMVQQLLHKEIDEGASGVTPAQIRAYYDAHRSDFVKPAMTRLMHAFYAKDHRDRAQAALDKALGFARLDYASFQKLAREESEDPGTKALDGDMRFLSDDELTQRYGPELVTAAATLKEAGEVSPSLVETAKGLHVLKLQGRQIALNLSVEEATPSIQSILAAESKQERFRALLERLKKQGKVELDEQVLAAIVVDPKAPAVEARTPPPTSLPGPHPHPEQ